MLPLFFRRFYTFFNERRFKKMTNRLTEKWINIEVTFKNGNTIIFTNVNRPTLDNSNDWLEFKNLDNQIIRINMLEILYTREYPDKDAD